MKDHLRELRTPNEIVAGNIRRIREALEIPRAEMVERLNRHHPRVTEWREGRLRNLEGADRAYPAPTPDDIYAVAKALGVTIFDLLLPFDDDTMVRVGNRRGLPITADVYSEALTLSPRERWRTEGLVAEATANALMLAVVGLHPRLESLRRIYLPAMETAQEYAYREWEREDERSSGRAKRALDELAEVRADYREKRQQAIDAALRYIEEGVFPLEEVGEDFGSAEWKNNVRRTWERIIA